MRPKHWSNSESLDLSRTVSDALIAAGQHSRIIAAKGEGLGGATLPKRTYAATSEEGQVAEAVNNRGVLRFPAYEKRSFRVA